MISLIRSEWYQARKAFSVRLAFVLTVVIGVWFEVAVVRTYASANSPEHLTVGGSLKNVMEDSAMCLLYASIFAGLMIGGAFENRTIQGELCSGKKRSHVYLAKMLVYLLVVSVLCLAYWFSGTVVIYARFGMGTPELIGNLSNPLYLAGMVAAGLLANISLSAICGMIGFFLQKTGAVMGGCLVLILVGGNMLASLLPKNVTAYFSYTPLRMVQNVLTYELEWKNVIMTCLLAVLWTVLILGIGVWKFRKAELK